MLHRLLLLALAVTLSSSQLARSEDMPLWKVVGDWQVRVDTTLNFGCFMAATSVRGTGVRIGLDQKNLNGYILVGNRDWRSLEVGKDYELVLQFDGNPPWRGNATVVRMGPGQAYLYLPFSKPEVMVEMAKKQVLSIWYESKQVAALRLTGSFAATQELVACQRAIEVERSGTKRKDPFAGGTSPRDPLVRGERPVSSDPFAQ